VLSPAAEQKAAGTRFIRNEQALEISACDVTVALSMFTANKSSAQIAVLKTPRSTFGRHFHMLHNYLTVTVFASI